MVPNEIKAQSVPWYLSPGSVMWGLVIAGPLALPFLWLSPKFSLKSKILISVLAVLITVWLMNSMVHILEALRSQLKDLKEITATA